MKYISHIFQTAALLVLWPLLLIAGMLNTAATVSQAIAVQILKVWGGK